MNRPRRPYNIHVRQRSIGLKSLKRDVTSIYFVLSPEYRSDILLLKNTILFIFSYDAIILISLYFQFIQ